MPITEKQRRFFGADLNRLRRGKKTKTGMTEAQLLELLHSGIRVAKRNRLFRKRRV